MYISNINYKKYSFMGIISVTEEKTLLTNLAELKKSLAVNSIKLENYGYL